MSDATAGDHSRGIGLEWPVLLVFVTAILYLAGSSYLTMYFSYFGVSLSEILPGPNDIFVYAFIAFYIFFEQHLPTIVSIGVLGGMFTVAVLILLRSTVLTMPRGWQLAATLVLAVLALWASYWIGIVTGIGRAEAAADNLPPMTVKMMGYTPVPLPEGEKLRFLYATETNIYAVSARGKASFWLYRLPTDRVVSSKVFSD